MRNNRPLRLLNFFSLPFFLFFLLLSYGQEKPQGQQVWVKEIFTGIEQKFEVRFSYLDRDIEGVYIAPPAAGLNLSETLEHIQVHTDLRFEMITERYIAVEKVKIPEICGVLIDSSTKDPLPGVTIYYDSKAVAVTNDSGKFYLQDISPAVILTFTHLGYSPVAVTASSLIDGDCNRIILEAAVEGLQETVVVNYLTSGISKAKDGSVNIDSERFGVLPGLLEPDVLQTLEALPGVESVNETISNINIRGGTSDQNLVLFDGIKMYLTGHFFGLISAFNSNLTTKATLTKNGSAPSLGEGVSGTIDISSQNELNGYLSGGAGMSLVSADAWLRIPVSEKVELHFSGRRSLNDIFNSPAYNSYFDRTFQDTGILPSVGAGEPDNRTANFNYYDFSFKVLYDLDPRHKLRLSMLYIDNFLDYTEFTNTQLAEEKRRSSLAQNNLAAGATWNAAWNNNFNTEFLGYVTRYGLEANNLTQVPQQQLLQQNEVLESGIKISGSQKFQENIQWTNGYHFYEVGVLNVEDINNPVFRSRIKNVIRTHAAFTELQYEKDRIFLMTGLRYNYFDKFQKSLVEPRLSFNYKVTSRVNYKVQGEYKSQITSQAIDLQEDFLGVENRRWILANNDDFPVIQSEQISTGLDFRGGGWYVDLEAYYKKVEGISTSNQGFQDQNEFRRVPGSYTARGVELLINKKYRNFHAYFGYTLTRSEYEFEELEPAVFLNNFDIPHSVSLAVNYIYRDLKFSFGGKWRSGRPFTEPVEGNPTRRDGNQMVVNYAEPNSSRLPYFFRLDASSSYKFQISEGVQVYTSLGFLNILNRENILNSYFRIDETDPSRPVRIDNTSLRFTPNALVRIEF
jgi:hypothetical protein